MHKLAKGIIATFILCFLFATTVYASQPEKAILYPTAKVTSIHSLDAGANGDMIKISLNGEYILSDTAPVIENDVTLVPVRAISEKLGATVDWDSQNRAVIVKNGEKQIRLSIDSKQAAVSNGAASRTVQLAAAAFIKEDRTMAPLRFIAEELGLKVEWDNVQRMISLTVGDSDDIKISVTVSGKNVENLDEFSQFKLSIPQIEGLKDKEIQDSLNESFEKKALEFKDKTFADLDEYVKAAKQGGFPIRTYEAVSDYRVTYIKNDLLSLYVDYYSYTGGAHGLTTRVSSNIDLKTGKELQLKDLVDPEVDYKAVINQEIKRQMQLDPEKYFPEALTTWQGISDDQPCYIEEGNLVVYFPLYEIAPYAGGIPQFEIPADVLPLNL